MSETSDPPARGKRGEGRAFAAALGISALTLVPVFFLGKWIGAESAKKDLMVAFPLAGDPKDPGATTDDAPGVEEGNGKTIDSDISLTPSSDAPTKTNGGLQNEKGPPEPVVTQKPPLPWEDQVLRAYAVDLPVNLRVFRDWTADDGGRLRARVVGRDVGVVILRTDLGVEYRVPISRLNSSDADLLMWTE